MKNLLAGLLMICGLNMSFVSVGKCEDMVIKTLIDHVGPATQFFSGKTKLALVDSVIQVGSVKGKSIFDLQAGYNQNSDGSKGDMLFGGGFLKISSLLQDSVTFPEHWKFLNSLEHGPILVYDFKNGDWRGAYQVGLAFGLNPK